MKRTFMMLFLVALSLLTPLMTLNSPSKGIEISLDLDVPLSNARIYVHVYAVTPNSTSIDVYRGFIYGNKLVVDEGFREFRKTVDAWLRYRGEDTSYYTSLIIDAWIVTPQRVFWVIRDKTVSYNPYLLRSGRTYTKTFRVESNDLIRYELKKPAELEKTSDITPSEPVCYYDWIKDGAKSYSVHTRIPLVIIYNKDHDYNKIYVTLSIDSNTGLEAQLGIAYGYKLSNYGPEAPQLTLYLGDPTYSRENAHFIVTKEFNYYGEQKYIYVNGTVAHELYKEYNTCYGYTGYEKERVYISDIDIDGANIVGGALNGLPPMYEELLEGVDLEHYITLEPQYTGVTWKSIADTRDVCGIGLSIGVGLGALLSILAPETIPSTLLAMMPF